MFKSVHIFLKPLLLLIILGFAFSFKFWVGTEGGSESLSVVAPPRSSPVASSASSADGKKQIPSTRIDLNTASAQELESLPGIGPKLAEAILEYRLRNGPFHKTEDLLAVKGIGPKKMNRIAAYLHVDRSP